MTGISNISFVFIENSVFNSFKLRQTEEIREIVNYQHSLCVQKCQFPQ